MKRIITIWLMLFVFGQIHELHAQTWVWEKGFGGNDDDEGYSIATDPLGYVYVAGKFKSASITFGSITLISTGQIDIFIAKFTAAGNAVWAKNLGGIYDDYARGIAVDVHGNVTIIGTFSSPSITVNTTTLTNNGQDDIIMARYDSAGNFLWAKSTGGANQDYGYCVTTDAEGYIYFGGYYSSASITFGTFVLPSNGPANIFFAKYDTLGNCIWAKHPTGTGFLYSLASDNFGHVFLGGTINSNENFGNAVTLNTSGAEDPFIAKFDTSGRAIWARGCTGIGSDWGESIATDPAGNAYLTGSFVSNNLTVGATVLHTVGSYDYFVAKYDSSGNALWAKSAGGTDAESPFGICTDHCWNVYVVGVFTSPAMTVGNTTLINPGVTTGEMFVTKYDSSGAVMWAKRGGGTNEDYCYGVVSDLNNYIYITGGYASDSATFGKDTLHNSGNYDVYLARIGASIKSSFAADDTVVCLHSSVTFTNYSINGNSFHWNFGDGNTSTAINPTYTYADTGTYTVSLIAYNNTPCGIISDSIKLVKYIKVLPGATTSFIADTTHGCTPLIVHFTNSSTNATTYLWNFGDGNTSTSTSPSHDKLLQVEGCTSLTTPQLAKILQLDSALSASTYSCSGGSCSWNSFESSWLSNALSIFNYECLREMVTFLGNYPIADAPVGGDTPDCSCSQSDDWCPGITSCGSISCSTSNHGCGTLWVKSCDGGCGGPGPSANNPNSTTTCN